MKAPYDVVLAPCATERGGVSELQLWHRGNRDPDKENNKCCTGMMNWNFLQCLVAFSHGTTIQTNECEISGHMAAQHFALETAGDEGQFVWNRGSGCVMPQAQQNQIEKKSTSCKTEMEVTSGSTLGGALPFSFHLQRQVGDKIVHTCVTIANEANVLRDCATDERAHVFHAEAVGDGFHVQVVGTPLCLDANSGGVPLLYPCYPKDIENKNQLWHKTKRALVWKGHPGLGRGACLEVEGEKVSVVSMSDGERPELRTCTDKVGQRLRRQEHGDGTFFLKDDDSGDCLARGEPVQAGGLETTVTYGPCNSDALWRELASRDQVQNVATSFCIDAGDEVKPILYPCHEPKAQRKQRFEVVREPGWVRIMSGWEDNGRRRFFERCLDRKPEPYIHVVVDQCDKARAAGTAWKRLAPRIPIETKLWRSAVKPPPGAPQLGG